MSLLVDEPPKLLPEAGVIRDARARRKRRRRIVAALLLGLAVMGALVAGFAGGLGHGSDARSDGERRLSLETSRGHEAAARAMIFPSLEGGSYGWGALVATNGVSGRGAWGYGFCCSLPVENGGGVGAVLGWSTGRREETITALLDARAKGFTARGQRGRIVTLGMLPYGLRLAQIIFPRQTKPVFGEGTGPDVLALGAGGKALGYMDSGRSFLRTLNRVVSHNPARWWQAPQPIPRGPCQIRAHGVRGLKPKQGHVAIRIRPYPRKIIGRAFFSCISTDYSLHNWPLTAAILLDAQRPGRTPAPIPGMTPVAGAPGVFNAPGDWHGGDITAARRGNAWLVVARGSGLSQRIEVLRHLSATASL